jgi:tyrosyl-tRNA synthetase
MKLARDIVAIYRDAEAAALAEAHFKQVFQKRELPEDMPTHELAAPQNIVDLLAEVGLAPSKSQARRLVAQGGVRLDGEKVKSIEETVIPGEEGAFLPLARPHVTTHLMLAADPSPLLQ